MFFFQETRAIERQVSIEERLVLQQWNVAKDILILSCLSDSGITLIEERSLNECVYVYDGVEKRFEYFPKSFNVIT